MSIKRNKGGEAETKNPADKKKHLLVITSGGDAPGMNPALRSVVRCWLAQGEPDEYKVSAVRNGYRGLVLGDIEELSSEDVAGILHRGGTEIGAGRCEELKKENSDEEEKIINNLRNIEDLAGIAVIGGNGSFKGMNKMFNRDDFKVKAVGIPATIDNDIWGTTLSLGVDTALNTVVEMIDKIRDTAAAFHRAFVIEIMGRTCGYLALATSVAVEAEGLFLPEEEPRHNELIEVLDNMNTLYEYRVRDSAIINVAEGSKLTRDAIKNIISSYTRWDNVRSVVPGYVQRGGRPTAIDRMLGSRLGWKAVERLKKNEKGTEIVVLKGTRIEAKAGDDVDDIINKSGEGSMKEDIGFKCLLETQKIITKFQKPLPSNCDGALLVIHGADAPGINAAIRSFTRTAMNNPLIQDKAGKHKYIRTVAVREGFQGLAAPRIDCSNFVELNWEKTARFTHTGGVPSKLAQKQIEPIRPSRRKWRKGDKNIDGDVAQMVKNIGKYEKRLGREGLKCKFRILVVIGGQDALNCCRDIKNAKFPLPIIYIPASIDNDILFTDYSIGFDSALNNAVKAIDNIKETALAEGRIFLIETMGGLSGFLPLSIGIASGAEHILIPELFKDNPPNEDDIKKLAQSVRKQFQTENESERKAENEFLPKTHSIIVLHEAIVKELGGMENIVKCFEKHAGVGQQGNGSESRDLEDSFKVRRTILGYIQRGGVPSAFDRILATMLGAKAAEIIPEIFRQEYPDGNDSIAGKPNNGNPKKGKTEEPRFPSGLIGVGVSDYEAKDDKSGKDYFRDYDLELEYFGKEEKFAGYKKNKIEERLRIHHSLTNDTWISERIDKKIIKGLDVPAKETSDYSPDKNMSAFWEDFWGKPKIDDKKIPEEKSGTSPKKIKK